MPDWADATVRTAVVVAAALADARGRDRRRALAASRRPLPGADRRRRVAGRRDAPGARRVPERQPAGAAHGAAAAGARAAAVTPGAPTGHVLSDLWQDLRYAARMFWKQPGFAATAVLTLALGIGATTAIFSVVYGVLLKPLPFAEPDRLVSVRQHAPHGAGTNQGPATYLTYRENQQAFEAIGAWDPHRGLDHRRRRSGACSGAARQLRHAAAAACATRARPGLQRRGRYARQLRCGSC